MKTKRLVWIVLVLLVVSLSACAGPQTKENLSGIDVSQKIFLYLDQSDIDIINTALKENDHDPEMVKCDIAQTKWTGASDRDFTLITAFPFQRKLHEAECAWGKTPEEAIAGVKLINGLSNEGNPNCRKFMLQISGEKNIFIIHACRQNDNDWDIVGMR